MIEGIERLKRAGEILRRVDGNADRPAVLSAAAEVWSAAADSLDAWPWQLQLRSVPMQFHLIRHGSPAATVRRMPDAELADLRRELLEFVESAERLDGEAIA